MRAAVFLAMEEQDKLEVGRCSSNVLQKEVLLTLTLFFVPLRKEGLSSTRT